MAKDIAEAVVALVREQEREALHNNLFRLTVSVTDSSLTIGDWDDLTKTEVSCATRTWVAARSLGGVLLSIGAGAYRSNDPFLISVNDAGDAAVRWYLRSEVTDLMIRANEEHAQVSRLSGLDDPDNPGMREMMMVMERVDLAVEEADAARLKARGQQLIGRDSKMKADGAAAAAVVTASGETPKIRADGCAVVRTGPPPGAAASAASATVVMKHRVILSCSSRKSEEGAAKAIEQALEFLTAGLGLVSSWRPAAPPLPSALSGAAGVTVGLP